MLARRDLSQTLTTLAALSRSHPSSRGTAVQMLMALRATSEDENVRFVVPRINDLRTFSRQIRNDQIAEG